MAVRYRSNGGEREREERLTVGLRVLTSRR
jgi:hypothetical protein